MRAASIPRTPEGRRPNCNVSIALYFDGLQHAYHIQCAYVHLDLNRQESCPSVHKEQVGAVIGGELILLLHQGQRFAETPLRLVADLLLEFVVQQPFFAVLVCAVQVDAPRRARIRKRRNSLGMDSCHPFQRNPPAIEFLLSRPLIAERHLGRG